MENGFSFMFMGNGWGSKVAVNVGVTVSVLRCLVNVIISVDEFPVIIKCLNVCRCVMGSKSFWKTWGLYEECVTRLEKISIPILIPVLYFHEIIIQISKANRG